MLPVGITPRTALLLAGWSNKTAEVPPPVPAELIRSREPTARVWTGVVLGMGLADGAIGLTEAGRLSAWYLGRNKGEINP